MKYVISTVRLHATTRERLHRCPLKLGKKNLNDVVSKLLDHYYSSTNQIEVDPNEQERD